MDLTGPAYQEFSLQYMQKIVDGLTREQDGTAVPVTLFTKGGGQWLEKIIATGCDAIGLDWTVDIGEARKLSGDRVALQGNLDPAVLYASPEVIRKEVEWILERYGAGSGHVFNLGHGIHPQISPGHVEVMVNAVHELSERFHDNT